MSEHLPLVAIVGPTAVGKTALAIRLAQELDGEIVSADSRQVYRYMDIGTAKPTYAERQQTRHHLIDILDPGQTLTLAEFQAAAYSAIDGIHRAGRLPLLVGGTGQYVRAIIEGWNVPPVAPLPALRADLESFADIYSSLALHQWLATVDPASGAATDYRNVRRAVRALEVYIASGQPFSQLRVRRAPPYRVLQIGLTRPRDRLYERVDRRVDEMIGAGLVTEVERLLGQGYTAEMPALSSLGYPQIVAYLRHELTLMEAIAEIKRATRRFIRHQANWFRLSDPAICWFDLETARAEDVVDFIRGWLRGEA